MTTIDQNNEVKVTLRVPMYEFMTEVKDDQSFSLFDFVDDKLNELTKQGKLGKVEEYYWNNHEDIDWDWQIIPASLETGHHQQIEFIYYFDKVCGYIDYQGIEAGDEFKDFCMTKKSGHADIKDHDFVEYDVESEN